MELRLKWTELIVWLLELSLKSLVVEHTIIGGVEHCVVEPIEVSLTCHMWFNQLEASMAAFDNTMLDAVNNLMLNHQSLDAQL